MTLHGTEWPRVMHVSLSLSCVKWVRMHGSECPRVMHTSFSTSLVSTRHQSCLVTDSFQSECFVDRPLKSFHDSFEVNVSCHFEMPVIRQNHCWTWFATIVAILASHFGAESRDGYFLPPVCHHSMTPPLYRVHYCWESVSGAREATDNWEDHRCRETRSLCVSGLAVPPSRKRANHVQLMTIHSLLSLPHRHSMLGRARAPRDGSLKSPYPWKRE